MRVLIVGSGGREHALAWKIAQSPLADKVFCAPGNGGISQAAECVAIKPEDIAEIVTFAKKEKVDLTVVGPEVPLALGIADELSRYKVRVFGPQKKAAQLEASKIFAKELMAKYHVPTAAFRVFDNAGEAKKYIRKKDGPCVVKADGLAAGKGVVVAQGVEEAERAVESMLEHRVFKDAGARIVIEDCLEGQEASILVFTDSREIVPMVSSQDHKRIFDNDKGPNTGGMGAYSPAPVVTEAVFSEVIDTIVRRTLDGLAREGIAYQGVLYAGVMITREGPKVLEFNVRFGDPETQVILPRLKSDLLEVMLAVSEGKLSRMKKLEWDSRPCVCVVCASAGYPNDYEKGKLITGISDAEAMPGIVVFHAGTQKSKDGIVSSGGRVLGVAGVGNTLQDSIAHTYRAVEKISFDGMQYRRDIGQKAVLI
jgi:phosphoribosylamine--glycine ligase